jgi:hypothetical protein
MVWSRSCMMQLSRDRKEHSDWRFLLLLLLLWEVVVDRLYSCITTSASSGRHRSLSPSPLPQLLLVGVG